MAIESPRDLAGRVEAALTRSGRSGPSMTTLVKLFEVMFAASVHTEEGEAIRFHLVFADPDNPDPAPPPRIRRDRWRPWKLEAELPFDIPTLVKLAKASDPRSSSLAVFGKRSRISIWGLIDQGTQYFDYMNFDSDSAQSYRPGIFQASVEGVAHIAAWIDYHKVGELRGTELLPAPIDALRQGPVLGALGPYLERLVDFAMDTLPESEREEVETIAKPTGGTAYLIALRRILLRARNYRHGGAVLIVPDPESVPHLNRKYTLNYDRLAEAVFFRVVTTLHKYSVDGHVFRVLDDDESALPVDLHLDQAVSEDELVDSRDEVNAAVWFISLLTRIDGLVLMSGNLSVRAFGVEITAQDAPQAVYRALNAKATRRKALDYNHFGTRHRSMMRFCAAVPDSVGFVISQDGAIRAMTMVGDDLVVWDDVMVQLLQDQPRPPPRRRRSPGPGSAVGSQSASRPANPKVS